MRKINRNNLYVSGGFNYRDADLVPFFAGFLAKELHDSYRIIKKSKK